MFLLERNLLSFLLTFYVSKKNEFHRGIFIYIIYMAYIFPYMETYLVLCSLIYLSYVVVALRIILVLVVYLGGGAHECRIPERLEKGAGSLALWLQVVVSSHAGVVNQTPVLWKKIQRS